MSPSRRVRLGPVHKRKIRATADSSIRIDSGNLVVLVPVKNTQAIIDGVIEPDDFLTKLGNVQGGEIQLQGRRRSWIRHFVPDTADVLLSDIAGRNNAAHGRTRRQR